MDNIETLKVDLRWQLSFEEIDWDYFMETVERARAAQQALLDQQ
ncbi:hypothetical protein LCGC14_0499250 [marine sediment metagenome]|uniref:Uncharacterized protein n=1 Tax=marine sediment metagenome TaxID=412755 RepID=A0A0F9S4B0_9ZZZZ